MPLSYNRMLNLTEAADFIGLSTRTLRRKIQTGELVAHRFGRLLRISEADLTAFVERHRSGATPDSQCPDLTT